MYTAARLFLSNGRDRSNSTLDKRSGVASTSETEHWDSPAPGKGTTVKSRVLLVDRHTLFLEAVGSLLKPDFDVMHITLHDIPEAIKLAAKYNPNILVLNPMVCGFNNIGLVRQMREAVPSAKILFLTETASLALAAAAFANGVSGFLVKHSSIADFVAALRALEQEKRFLDPSLADGNVDAALQFQSPAARLTPREFEVLGRILRGWSMKQVARELKVTPRTVAFHKYRAMQTLEVQNNAQLIEAAGRLGLLGPE